MSHAALVYPHQLFGKHPALDAAERVFLIEDPLYFRQYRFHKQKLLLHRASMKYFAESLVEAGKHVTYLDAVLLEHSGDVCRHLTAANISKVSFVELDDDWLSSRVLNALAASGKTYQILKSPSFLCDSSWAKDYFEAQNGKLLMATFYVEQRKRLHILMQNGKPEGGKWSFDNENRKRLPKNCLVPEPYSPPRDALFSDAVRYVEEHFSDNHGEIEAFHFPLTHAQAERALEVFLNERFEQFGAFQDAISSRDSFLFHSGLSAALNLGLLLPGDVVEQALVRYRGGGVSLNSVEGFIRQIIGWREYVRAVYQLIGRKQRTRNFFKHTRSLSSAFWNGTTGILPIDEAIQRVLRTGYANHIERLMLFSNFMLLCEIEPDQVYEWFMSLFIDAFDWVMVPNVYGMSLFADGGMITTKPYVSSSNYIRKMSQYPAGEWSLVWDSLYWRFVETHRSLFEANPRVRMLTKHIDRMGPELMQQHRERAARFLQSGAK